MDAERSSTLPPGVSIEQARRETEYWQRMDVEERAARLFEWNDLQRLLVRELIRRRHPQYSDREAQLAMGRVYLGEELFAKAFPGVDVRW